MHTHILRRSALTTAIAFLIIPLGLITRVPSASAWSSVNNAAIATKALQYVNRWGGAACVDAGTSGYTGGAPLGDGNNMDGECRSFVNCILKTSSALTPPTGRTTNRLFATTAASRSL